ncbi:helix-turn-helix transcriptional regulator [Microcoleus sp. Pol11C1]|uniref:helix-turn-helix transcriptional regulator n=1 Tax=unclassified Microcoleus TaxID=2642155 RepID=UPI002FD0926B
MSPESNNLGSFLASARQYQKLTLRAVETETGISNAYISQLERGKIRSPSPVILRKLSDLYNIPYTTLLELAGYPVPQSGKLDTSLTDIAARLGPVSPDEADELADYLKYLRSKQNKRKR